MNYVHIYLDEFREGMQSIFNGVSSTDETIANNFIKNNKSTCDDFIESCVDIASEDVYNIFSYGSLYNALFNSTDLYDCIEFCIKNIPNFDILYLTTYGNSKKISNSYNYKNIQIFNVDSPRGVECILVSPNGLKKLRNIISIMKKDNNNLGLDYYLCNINEINKITTYPPLFYNDPLKSNVVKSSVFEEEINYKKPPELTKKYYGNLNVFWFFFIVIFIIFLFIVVMNLGGVKFVNKGTYDGKLGNVPEGKGDLTGDLIS